MFPGVWASHSTSSEGWWSVEVAACHLYSCVFNTRTFQLVTGAQENLLTVNTMVVASANVTQQLGEGGALAWQWEVKAQLGSGVDRTLLLERTTARTPG